MRIFPDPADDRMAAMAADRRQDAHASLFVANDQHWFIQHRERQIVPDVWHLIDVRNAQPLAEKYGVLFKCPEFLACVGFRWQHFGFLDRKHTERGPLDNFAGELEINVFGSYPRHTLSPMSGTDRPPHC